MVNQKSQTEQLDARLNDLFRGLPITSNAYAKAHLYSDIASDIAGQKVEVYGYLIASRNSVDGVVRDVYLSHNQTASRDRLYLDESSMSQTATQIREQGYKILGWWHSHKGLALKRHSPQDDRNFCNIMYFLFPHNKKPIDKTTRRLGKPPYRIEVEDNVMRIISDSVMPQTLIIEFSGAIDFPKHQVESLYHEQTPFFGFAYSLILNDDISKPYCEIAVYDPATQKVTFLKYVPLLEVEKETEINLDSGSLAKDVKERVIFNLDQRPRYDTQQPLRQNKLPSEGALENQIQDYLAGSPGKFDPLLREKLLGYADMHSRLGQTHLLDSADTNKIYDVYIYLTTRPIPHANEKSESPNQLDKLVAEVVSDIRSLANVQIQFILQSIDFLNRSIKSLQAQIGQPSYYRSRELKELRKQADSKEKDIEQERALLGLWQSVKQMSDANGTGSRIEN